MAVDRTRTVLLVALLALLAAGFWAYHGVEGSLREIRATGLRTLLNTQVGTLEQWIAERRHETEQVAADPELRQMSASLLLGRAASAQELAGLVLERTAAIGVTGLLLVDPGGTIRAASDPTRIGRHVSSDFLLHLSRVLEGGASFIRPSRHGTVDGSPSSLRTWVAAPVRNGSGRILGAIALGSPTATGFAPIFEAARPGDTGEALVFDAEGWLLAPSRHAAEMERRGLVPRMSPPGADGDRLTALASAAVATREGGGEGLLLDAYTGHLGHEVIGAWRWLPEHDIGMAVEIVASEAYAPLAYLQGGFALILALLAVVWFALFARPEMVGRLLPQWGIRTLGPYRLHRQIGEGAVSNVYLATHRLLKRPAAVKVLKHQAGSDEWIARFRREVQLSSQLRQPNTIAIHDFGIGPQGDFWYAMEYLEGLSLGDLVERCGPVTPPRTSHILRQVCASLQEAHSRGLVHRDIKPQNIMLCQLHGARDMVKVLDFGLVKQIGGDETRDLTAHMRILGTPLYMSPERIRNPADADGRADIYALGAVGFFLLTGKRLFETETEHDLTYHVLHVRPRPVAECSPFAVPAELDALIGHCLEKDPAARPQNVADVAEVLDGLLARQPWRREHIEAWWRHNWVAAAGPERRYATE